MPRLVIVRGWCVRCTSAINLRHLALNSPAGIEEIATRVIFITMVKVYGHIVFDLVFPCQSLLDLGWRLFLNGILYCVDFAWLAEYLLSYKNGKGNKSFAEIVG